jgi:hypothetical protein
MVRKIDPSKNDTKTTSVLLALFPFGMLGAIALIYIILLIADHKEKIIDWIK